MMFRRSFRVVAYLLVSLQMSALTAFGQGRDITPDDWAERIPILLLSIVVVIFVDYLFIRQIRKNSGKDDRSIWERDDV